MFKELSTQHSIKLLSVNVEKKEKISKEIEDIQAAKILPAIVFTLGWSDAVL